MRRTLGLALLAIVAAAPVLPATPASACDPNRPVLGCDTPCTFAARQYTTVRNAAGRGPTWSNLDLGVCGT